MFSPKKETTWQQKLRTTYRIIWVQVHQFVRKIEKFYIVGRNKRRKLKHARTFRCFKFFSFLYKIYRTSNINPQVNNMFSFRGNASNCLKIDSILQLDKENPNRLHKTQISSSTSHPLRILQQLRSLPYIKINASSITLECTLSRLNTIQLPTSKRYNILARSISKQSPVY